MRLHHDRLVLPAAALALALACAVGAQAQTPRAVSGGSAQFYVGDVAIPHPGFGGAQPTPYAFLITSGNGQTLRLPAQGLTHEGPGQVFPAGFYGLYLFQAYTNLSLRFPATGQSAVFAPDGRTGADSYVWCPGQTGFGGGGNVRCSLTPSDLSVTVPFCGNTPNDCPNTTGQTMMLNVSGDLGWARYTRTAHQVGGPARSNLGGTFNQALQVGLPLPPVEAAFVAGAPFPTGAVGAAFGSYIQHAVPSEPGIRVSGGVGTGGILYGAITQTGLTGQCAFLGLPGNICLNNTTASFGVPFTGGMLTLAAPGGDELFVLTGSDNRNASGSGNVTLVGGSLSERTFTAEDANRGILTLQVPEPAPLAGLAGALLALAGAHRLARRRSR